MEMFTFCLGSTMTAPTSCKSHDKVRGYAGTHARTHVIGGKENGRGDMENTKEKITTETSDVNNNINNNKKQHEETIQQHKHKHGQERIKQPLNSTQTLTRRHSNQLWHGPGTGAIRAEPNITEHKRTEQNRATQQRGTG